MQKIPTLFVRDQATKLVTKAVTPGAEWVIRGEGFPTRKYDGTACLIREGKLYKRYDAKRGKTPPKGFLPAQPEPDPITGHHPGWILVGDGPEDRWHQEALEAMRSIPEYEWTYELCGPKIQGNPERLDTHMLIRHGDTLLAHAPHDFTSLRDYLDEGDIEGLVWWRGLSLNCEKVKIKAKDFGLKRR